MCEKYMTASRYIFLTHTDDASKIKQKTNGLLCSSDYILSRLRKDTISICVPNLYRKGFAFFPQSSFKAIELMRPGEESFVVYTDDHDKIITEYYKNGYSKKQIAELILCGEVFAQEEIIKKRDEMFKDFYESEKYWDIKIADWILDNYKSRCIFMDPGHICAEVYYQYCLQLFEIIKLDIHDMAEIFNELPYTYMPIYGCVSKTLDLTWTEETNKRIKKNSFTLNDSMLDIEEYVNQYIFMCVDI